MRTPSNTVRRFIKRHSMLNGAARVLVAVSGGADSVVLLDILARLTSGFVGWGAGAVKIQDVPVIERSDPRLPIPNPHLAGPRPPIPSPPIHVAHLDHMLRGRESAEDAEFVRSLADRLGLEYTIRSADVRAIAEARGRGIEEVARELRYDFLLAAAREAGCDRIAVGHTMTDQAETFLMRLVRGAGLRGLVAMRPVSEVPVFRQEKVEGRREKAEGRREKGERGRQKAECRTQKADGPVSEVSAFHQEEAEGRRRKADDESLPSAFRLLPSAFPLPPSVLLIRPLLCITREQVDEYCTQRSLEFRTDSTNKDLHYTRNQVRGEIFPVLRAINPRIVESIARAAENIAGDHDVLDHLATSLLEKACLAPDAGRKANEGTVAYSIDEFLRQPAALRRRMIIEASRPARTSVPGKWDIPVGEITSAHVAAIEGLLEPRASGKHVTLPRALDVWREFNALVFKPLARAIADPPYQTAISLACPAAEAGGFAFTLQRRQPVELLKSTMEQTQLEAKRIGRDWMSVALDDDALPESLVIRPRLPGERAQVIGHRQLIKLKNLMIDHRIPTSSRANWPMVTTPDGCYVWSPGLPPSLKFAAHDGTKRFAIMRASAT